MWSNVLVIRERIVMRSNDLIVGMFFYLHGRNKVQCIHNETSSEEAEILLLITLRRDINMQTKEPTQNHKVK